MKTILVASDFSDHANVAGQYAIRLARLLDANLVCVHATIMGESQHHEYEIAHDKLEEFRAYLQEQMGQKRKWLSLLSDEAGRQGVKSQHHLVDGSPAEAVCSAAEEVSADLVVMGSHGHTGFKRILLGSVAEKTVRLCGSSVLVARQPVVGENGFHNILVPTDFSDSASAAIDQACVLAAPDATVDILNCWQVAGFTEGPVDPMVGPATVYSTMADTITADAERRGKTLVERVTKTGRKARLHLFRGHPSAGVQTFLDQQEHAYDLVAVGTHGRTGLSRMLVGSVAEVTVRYSPCSVLVARVQK